jgi:acetate kinase
VDPGVLVHLLEAQGTSDMRDLLGKESSDPHAADAVALFCYLVRKCVGGLVAALGGLDTLIFTAGIGEHAAPVRERICDGLEFLGIDLEPSATPPTLRSSRAPAAVWWFA